MQTLYNIIIGVWIIGILAYGFRQTENARWYKKPIEFLSTVLAAAAIGALAFFYRGVEAEVVQVNVAPDFSADKPHGVDLTIKADGSGGEIYTLICYDGKSFEDTFEIGDNETKTFRVNLWKITAIDPELLTKISESSVSVSNVRLKRLLVKATKKSCKPAQ